MYSGLFVDQVWSILPALELLSLHSGGEQLQCRQDGLNLISFIGVFHFLNFIWACNTVGEIDSRADSFDEAVARGKDITDLSPDIAEKLEELERDKQEINELWELKLVEYNQCMDLQLFYR